jgi:hypothetical protein
LEDEGKPTKTTKVKKSELQLKDLSGSPSSSRAPEGTIGKKW